MHTVLFKIYFSPYTARASWEKNCILSTQIYTKMWLHHRTSVLQRLYVSPPKNNWWDLIGRRRKKPYLLLFPWYNKAVVMCRNFSFCIFLLLQTIKNSSHSNKIIYIYLCTYIYIYMYVYISPLDFMVTTIKSWLIVTQTIQPGLKLSW